MDDELTPRRRSLRPRNVTKEVQETIPSPRPIRSSRARVSAGDFLVFDNEDDLDWEKNRVAELESASSGPAKRNLRDRSGRREQRQRRELRSTRLARETRSESRSIRESKSNRELRSSRERRSRRDKSSARSQNSVRENGLRKLTRSRQKPQLSSRAARASRRTNQRFGIIGDDEDEEEEEEEEDVELEVFDEIESDSISDEVTSSDLESDLSDLEEGLIGTRSKHSSRTKTKSKGKGSTRKAKPLFPEDVPGRQLTENQPEPDPEKVEWSPSVAFIAIFVATFVDIFPDLPHLPSPQDIEEGVMSEEPSELVELLFRRLLGLVLNRKKELEVGKYGSALSELHSLLAILGQSPTFPPLNWKSRASAFAELAWYDRVELLHVLIHWSLVNSDRVKALLRALPEENAMPWMGADPQGNHYYIVGFDPIAEGSQEYTRFRIYRETNRLLATVKWEPIASNYNEVIAFLKSHEIKSAAQLEAEAKKEEDAKIAAEAQSASAETNSATEVPNTKEELTGEAELNEEAAVEAAIEETEEAAEADEVVEPESEPEPVKYNLPDTVVEILQNLIPTMQLSEEISYERIRREAKKARRRQDIVYHAEAIARGEGRYSGRVRRRRVNYTEMINNSFGRGDSSDDDEGRSSRRKRRLRARDSDYEWAEPEPETRQQRHARLLADRRDREGYADATPEIIPTESYESTPVDESTGHQGHEEEEEVAGRPELVQQIESPAVGLQPEASDQAELQPNNALLYQTQEVQTEQQPTIVDPVVVNPTISIVNPVPSPPMEATTVQHTLANETDVVGNPVEPLTTLTSSLSAAIASPATGAATEITAQQRESPFLPSPLNLTTATSYLPTPAEPVQSTESVRAEQVTEQPTSEPTDRQLSDMASFPGTNEQGNFYEPNLRGVLSLQSEQDVQNEANIVPSVSQEESAPQLQNEFPSVLSHFVQESNQVHEPQAFQGATGNSENVE